MGRSLEVAGGRIISRRAGSVDWQDAMESFGLYSAMIEDHGARELLMNMSEAEIQIPGGDARDLATMFIRSTPAELAMAVIKPLNETGSRFIGTFIEVVEAQGRTIATVVDESEAAAFFARTASAPDTRSGGWLSRLFGRGRAAKD